MRTQEILQVKDIDVNIMVMEGYLGRWRALLLVWELVFQVFVVVVLE